MTLVFANVQQQEQFKRLTSDREAFCELSSELFMSRIGESPSGLYLTSAFSPPSIKSRPILPSWQPSAGQPVKQANLRRSGPRSRL